MKKKSAENSTTTVVGKPFPKGKSGNPGGRPKTPQEVREAFQKFSMDALKTLVSIMNKDEAKDSDKIRAAECILDRAWGKPYQAVEIDNGDHNFSISFANGEEYGV